MMLGNQPSFSISIHMSFSGLTILYSTSKCSAHALICAVIPGNSTPVSANIQIIRLSGKLVLAHNKANDESLPPEKAIKINIEIMRVFVRYRALLKENEVLKKEVIKLDDKLNQSFKFLLEKIDALHQKN